MKFRNRIEINDYIQKRLGSVELTDLSTPSYSLKNKNREKRYATLARVFDIPQDKVQMLKDAYSQASSGQGNESANLLTIHSSALLALLCFYNVEDENIKIKPSKDSDEYEFDRVFFEVENIVANKSDRNSSIDVALWSSKNKILLLLESKFTEPLTGSNMNNIAEKYVERLDLLSKFGIKRSSDKAPFKFECQKRKIGKSEHLLYYEGIKQMIAHLIGVETGPAKGEEVSMIKRKKQDDYSKYFDKADKIFLGTILFKDETLFDKEKEYPLIEEYVKLYKDTMSEIKQTISNPKIELLTEPLTYQEIFGKSSKNKLGTKILKFYNLDNTSSL